MLVKGTPEVSSLDGTRLLAVSGARDLDTLLIGTSGHLVAHPEHDILLCKVCLPNFKPDIDCRADAPKTPGVIRYSFSNGTSFPRPMTVPREFSRLKDTVKCQLTSKGHSKALEERDVAAVRDAEELKKRKGACRNSLLAAYSVMKHSMPVMKMQLLC